MGVPGASVDITADSDASVLWTVPAGVTLGANSDVAGDIVADGAALQCSVASVPLCDVLCVRALARSLTGGITLGADARLRGTAPCGGDLVLGAGASVENSEVLAHKGHGHHHDDSSDDQSSDSSN